VEGVAAEAVPVRASSTSILVCGCQPAARAVINQPVTSRTNLSLGGGNISVVAALANEPAISIVDATTTLLDDLVAGFAPALNQEVSIVARDALIGCASAIGAALVQSAPTALPTPHQPVRTRTLSAPISSRIAVHARQPHRRAAAFAIVDEVVVRLALGAGISIGEAGGAEGVEGGVAGLAE